MYTTFLYSVVLGCLATAATSQAWEIGMSRGLATYEASANDGALLLVCDPDRVYNPDVSYAHISVAMPEDLASREVVFLAATGQQARFSVRDGIATQQEADPVAWSKLIDMIEAGGQIVAVTALDSFTLDLDASPGFPCR